MINKNLLRAVTDVLDSKNSKSYARNALVDYGRGELVATDGSILVVIATPEIKKIAESEGLVGRVCFTVAELKKFVRIMRSTDTFNCTRAEIERVWSSELSEQDARDDAAEYPDYKRATPGDVTPSDSGVFGRYAAKHMKVLEDIEHSILCERVSYHLPARRVSALKIVFDCGDEMMITVVLLPENVEKYIVNRGNHVR